jgi:hypothetical protein
MIPEAAVEAAARIIYRDSGRKRVMSYEDAREACEADAIDILEAAYPAIAEEVWDAAYRTGHHDSARRRYRHYRPAK